MTLAELARRVRESLADNAWYKLLSLLIALALWFIVRDERVEETVTVALDVNPASAELVLSGDPPEVTVGVTVGVGVTMTQLLSRIETLLPLFATARSGLLSPLKSPTATEKGPPPAP